jgi:catechol 2,3-dioxygenase-like lactoylglutathione lyase family enzyme
VTRLARLLAIALTPSARVRDLPRSVAFYQKALGLEDADGYAWALGQKC